MELDFAKYKVQQFCDNLDCDDYRKVDSNNIRIHSRLHHQVYCNTCKQIWGMTKGTFFYNLKAPVPLILEVLNLLSEGMGVRAVCRNKGVIPDAVGAWVQKAAKHVNEVTVYLERDMHLTPCQIDEFWSYIEKKAHLSADELDREDLGDRWTFVNVLPRSSFIQTVHHGKRTQDEGEQFVETIQQNSDGEAPLFLSDGCHRTLRYSPTRIVMKNRLYAGRGRPRKPMRIIDDNRKYVQVIKHKEGGRLIEIEQRVIWRTEDDILDIIRQEKRGQTINTNYVESRNENYRKDNKLLGRRSACQPKEVALHDASIDLLTGIYNFVDENREFRQCINPNAKSFEVKYKKYSLAILEGFTDHCLTLEELLMCRVPK